MEDKIESETAEFKRVWSDKALKSVVAFLNSHGGRIYVGVSDDGSAVGVDDADNLSTSISSSISDNIRPNPIVYTSIEISEEDGKRILIVKIPEGTNKPYYLKDKGPKEGGVFIRCGPSSMPIPHDAILKIFRDTATTSYEDRISMEQDLTFEQTERVFRNRGVEFSEAKMESLGMKSDGRYTNLAFMLSDQFNQDIKMAVYEDDYKSSFIDRAETAGSLLKQFEDAFAFVQKHNALRSRIVGAYRQDSREFPEEAVREAIINAIAHRDYGFNGSTLISIFGDRLEINSLGGLRLGLNIEDILLGASSRRNEHLASIMYRLRIMETYGTGIPRIMGMYRDEPVKPRIEITTNVFKLTLPKMLFRPISPEASRAYALLDARDSIKRSEIEDILGISKSKAISIISELEAAGMVSAIGAGKSIAYVRSKRSSDQ